MCGIAGILDLKGAREICAHTLKRMTDAIAHRGPDGEDFYRAPGIGLGHRRLAIIDLEGGRQPFISQSGRSVLSYNGEIYNYAELAKTLAGKGASIRTRSDTEALTEGLDLEGADFVEKLRGMFAFAWWNNANKKLTLCRDRLGERPLYYAQTEDGFLLFASEIGAIAASGMVDLDLDPEAVSDYFHFGYVPDPKSIYRRIRKLPPGHILTARQGSPVQLRRYWRPVFKPAQTLNFNEAKEELLALLDDAVRAQLVSDVPLGAFLSGGVDSSAIVASMAQSATQILSCAIGFEEDSHDERRFAQAVAERYQTTHREDVARIDAADEIDVIARAFGEPFADASALPTYAVCRLARQHVTVALSGDGGDEIFGGYRRYRFFGREERLRAMAPHNLRRATFGVAGALYPKLDWAPQPLRFKTTFQALGESSAEAYLRAAGANLPDRAAAMLSGDVMQSLNGYHPVSVIEAASSGAGADNMHPLLKAQQIDLETWLPGRMLTKVDRAAMAHSLEVRPPLLDHRLVEWAGALDAASKIGPAPDGGETGKRILKAAHEDRLSSDILYRPKQGFGLPISAWLKQQDGPLERLHQSDAWRKSGVLNATAIDTMGADHQSGRFDYSQELWTVIMFDAFLRNGAGAMQPHLASDR